MPSIASPSQMLRASDANSGHFSSINCHQRESAAWHTIQSLDLFFTCQVISNACPSVLYICFNLGIIGKCLNTF
jgi:hypothetical protein